MCVGGGGGEGTGLGEEGEQIKYVFSQLWYSFGYMNDIITEVGPAHLPMKLNV